MINDVCSVGGKPTTQVGTCERCATTNTDLTVFLCNIATVSKAWSLSFQTQPQVSSRLAVLPLLARVEMPYVKERNTGQSALKRLTVPQRVQEASVNEAT